MKTVIELEAGKWVELETVEDGMWAQERNQTAVGIYFRRELDERAKGTQDRAPVVFYAFEAKDGSVPVTCCVNRGDRTSSWDKTLVTGFQNSNPYAGHAGVIGALGAHIGHELGPDKWPYGRATIEDDEEPSAAP